MIKLKSFLRRIQTKIYLILVTILLTALTILTSYINYLHKLTNDSYDNTKAIYVITNKDLTKDLSKLKRVKKVTPGITLNSTLTPSKLYFSNTSYNQLIGLNKIYLFPTTTYKIETGSILLPRSPGFEDIYWDTNYTPNIHKSFEFSNSSSNFTLKVQDYYPSYLEEVLVNSKTFNKLYQSSKEYVYKLTLKDYIYYSLNDDPSTSSDSTKSLEIEKDIKNICSDCKIVTNQIDTTSLLLDNNMYNFLELLNASTNLPELILILTNLANVINIIFLLLLLIVTINIIIDENKYLILKRKLGYNLKMLKKDLIVKIIFLLITSTLISIFLSLILKLILNHYFHLQMVIFSFKELLVICKYIFIILVLSGIFIQIKYLKIKNRG